MKIREGARAALARRACGCEGAHPFKERAGV